MKNLQLVCLSIAQPQLIPNIYYACKFNEIKYDGWNKVEKNHNNFFLLLWKKFNWLYRLTKLFIIRSIYNLYMLITYKPILKIHEKMKIMKMLFKFHIMHWKIVDIWPSLVLSTLSILHICSLEKTHIMEFYIMHQHALLQQLIGFKF